MVADWPARLGARHSAMRGHRARRATRLEGQAVPPQAAILYPPAALRAAGGASTAAQAAPIRRINYWR